MSDFKSFFKKNYRILIPIMVIVALLVTIFFLYKEYKYDNTRNKEEISMFQSVGGVKLDGSAVVTYNLKNAIVDVQIKDDSIDNNIYPIYYEDMSKVIFPTEMTIAFPLRDGSQFKLYKYATYYNVDDVHFIKNNTDDGNYSDFFLYDGKSLFFFPDETTLKIGDKEEISLGAMSSVKLGYNNVLSYYDAKTDTADVIELGSKKATVKGKYFDVSISGRYFYSFSNKILLHTPGNLNPVFKTIDK